MLVRGADLADSMSRYLVDRISGLPNVEVVTHANVTGLEGHDGILEAIRWRRRGVDNETRQLLRHMFLFIGADPNTDWLTGSGIALDAKGFVLTGGADGTGRHALETSRRGVYAIGEVRSGSVKRVAAAVGEGAQIVAALHATFASAQGDQLRDVLEGRKHRPLSICSAVSMRTRSPTPLTARPPIAAMISPSFRPAFAAGPPIERNRTAVRLVTCYISATRQYDGAGRDVDDGAAYMTETKRMISVMTKLAVLEATAKAMLCAP